jgi:hypothetical protein
MNEAAFVKSFSDNRNLYRVFAYLIAGISTLILCGRLWEISAIHRLTFVNIATAIIFFFPLAFFILSRRNLARAVAKGVLTQDTLGLCDGIICQWTFWAYLVIQATLSLH